MSRLFPTEILDRERTIAGARFDRWLVPPAALAIHLCIGMAYGFSVFWLPLTEMAGAGAGESCAGRGLPGALFARDCAWSVAEVGWIYTLFFVFLGSSAALWGGWLERAGPRKAGVVAALCWCGGLAVAALGVRLHQLWIVWLGAGVVGGIGLGLGYISPVSTLIKWFPDRRGLATGMAIMGFGGGAMIGAPLADLLMRAFRTEDDAGVWQTLMVLALIYLAFMLAGAFGYRLPPPGWRPRLWTPRGRAVAADRYVHFRDAHKTRQFWLLWAMLFLNVTAGIGIIGMASPMFQEIFAGALVNAPGKSFVELDGAERARLATVAAGFAGLLSLFNIGGRFFWASLSDRIGRRATYTSFFVLGAALYVAAPFAARTGDVALFAAVLCVVVSMYGGGFATIPAYIADLFGTQFVSAIHGRVLTAWSVAGIAGPVAFTYVREAEIAAGVPRAAAYDLTLYALAALLVAGLAANLLVRPVSGTWLRADPKPPEAPPSARAHPASAAPDECPRGPRALTLAAWLAVGLPLGWGTWITLEKTAALLR